MVATVSSAAADNGGSSSGFGSSSSSHVGSCGLDSWQQERLRRQRQQQTRHQQPQTQLQLRLRLLLRGHGIETAPELVQVPQCWRVTWPGCAPPPVAAAATTPPQPVRDLAQPQARAPNGHTFFGWGPRLREQDSPRARSSAGTRSEMVTPTAGSGWLSAGAA
jgi:hypothetical protein